MRISFTRWHNRVPKGGSRGVDRARSADPERGVIPQGESGEVFRMQSRRKTAQQNLKDICADFARILGMFVF